jgi:AcrR family transcriptional regulator
VFGEKGYERATMDEIAAASHMSKATLYRYVTSKSELRDLLLQRLPEADLEVRDVRARILAVAMETIGRKGYSRTTLDDIAAAAGVSKGGIYWHFKGKDDLMAAVIAEQSPLSQVTAIVEEANGAPLEEVMPRIYDALLSFLELHGDFFYAVLSEIRTNHELGHVFQRNVAQPLLAVVGAYLVMQSAQGNVRAAHPMLLLQALIGPLAVHVALRPVVEQRLGMRLDLAEVRETLLGIYLDGIRSSPQEAGHDGSGG